MHVHTQLISFRFETNEREFTAKGTIHTKQPLLAWWGEPTQSKNWPTGSPHSAIKLELSFHNYIPRGQNRAVPLPSAGRYSSLQESRNCYSWSNMSQLTSICWCYYCMILLHYRIPYPGWNYHCQTTDCPELFPLVLYIHATYKPFQHNLLITCSTLDCRQFNYQSGLCILTRLNLVLPHAYVCHAWPPYK